MNCPSNPISCHWSGLGTLDLARDWIDALGRCRMQARVLDNHILREKDELTDLVFGLASDPSRCSFCTELRLNPMLTGCAHNNSPEAHDWMADACRQTSDDLVSKHTACQVSTAHNGRWLFTARLKTSHGHAKHHHPFLSHPDDEYLVTPNSSLPLWHSCDVLFYCFKQTVRLCPAPRVLLVHGNGSVFAQHSIISC